jgi:hypothetical protein
MLYAAAPPPKEKHGPFVRKDAVLLRPESSQGITFGCDAEGGEDYERGVQFPQGRNVLAGGGHLCRDGKGRAPEEARPCSLSLLASRALHCAASSPLSDRGGFRPDLGSMFVGPYSVLLYRLRRDQPYPPPPRRSTSRMMMISVVVFMAWQATTPKPRRPSLSH